MRITELPKHISTPWADDRAKTAAQAQNQHMEVIQPPNYDRNMFIPFVPTIKIKSGKVLWLAGCELGPDRSAFRDESSSASLALMNSN
jgi:hypothetical protein